ncbi:12162_t:CDS:2 [Ambispora gerdemannii]|uniref:12162_t:CDS:1 n=1 Tax=Ambispora gerdemannii TaxID=144530 RepID=A0A9N9AKQ9_9GLOM|nr:12162_t:CDS:2 [Ambispora gerdemannii]
MSKPSAAVGTPVATTAPAPTTAASSDNTKDSSQPNNSNNNSAPASKPQESSSETGNNPLPSLSAIPTISVANGASPSSATVSATQSGSVDPTSTDSGSSSDSGGMSAGVMIGGMMAATLIIVVFITYLVRRKIRSNRQNARRASHRLHDTEYNDTYAIGQPTYFEEKHGSNPRRSIIRPNNNQISSPDSVFVDPNPKVNFAPVRGQRQSIYRQSTGVMYEPPRSLMPVNGNYASPLPTNNGYYANYDDYNTEVMGQYQQQYLDTSSAYVPESNYTANHPIQRSPTYIREHSYEDHGPSSPSPPPGH